MQTRLNFYNRTVGGVAQDVLLFQRDVIPSLGERAFAWKVIRNCGVNCYHPFVFSNDLAISLGDDYGNYSVPLPVIPGQILSISPFGAGRRLATTGMTTGTRDIEVRNDLPRGAVTVNILKDGLLLARKTAVAPQQEVVVQYRPTLWIGSWSQAEQGAAIDSAVIDQFNTEFSLLGVISADIVMTGGGSGPTSAPYVFTMENIVMA